MQIALRFCHNPLRYFGERPIPDNLRDRDRVRQTRDDSYRNRKPATFAYVSFFRRTVFIPIRVIALPLAAVRRIVRSMRACPDDQESYPNAGLFLFSLNVRAHYDEPHGQRSLPENAGSQIVWR